MELTQNRILYKHSGHIVLCFVFSIMSADPVLSNDLDKTDLVVVYKSEAKLILKKNGNILKSYKVAFGGNPEGHKQYEGDQRTPEGQYVLDFKKSNSSYYKAIHISYPNQEDKARAKKAGVNPGGDIMIHGQKNGFGWLGYVVQWFNWTNGCIAVRNSEMDEIWKMVPTGTPIIINP